MALHVRCWLVALALAVLLPLAPDRGEAADQRAGDWLRSADRSALAQTHVVQIGTLNFRAGPDTRAEVLSVVREGDYLLKLDETMANGTKWLRVIRGDGREGWVAARYVGAVDAILGVVEGAAAFLVQL